MSEENRVYRKNGNMVGRKIADEFILVPIRQKAGDLQHIYTLNTVGTRIWELVDGQKTLEDVITAIVTEYEVEVPQAIKDTLAFLTQMEAVGAIVPVTEEAVPSSAKGQTG